MSLDSQLRDFALQQCDQAWRYLGGCNLGLGEAMSEMENIIGDSSFTCERASRRLSWPECGNNCVSPHQLSALCVLVFLLGTPGWSQARSEERGAHTPSQKQRQQRGEEQLNVNFLYGAYIPKEASLVS